MINRNNRKICDQLKINLDDFLPNDLYLIICEYATDDLQCIINSTREKYKNCILLSYYASPQHPHQDQVTNEDLKKGLIPYIRVEVGFSDTYWPFVEQVKEIVESSPNGFPYHLIGKETDTFFEPGIYVINEQVAYICLCYDKYYYGQKYNEYAKRIYDFIQIPISFVSKKTIKKWRDSSNSL